MYTLSPEQLSCRIERCFFFLKRPVQLRRRADLGANSLWLCSLCPVTPLTVNIYPFVFSIVLKRTSMLIVRWAFTALLFSVYCWHIWNFTQWHPVTQRAHCAGQSRLSVKKISLHFQKYSFYCDVKLFLQKTNA